MDTTLKASPARFGGNQAMSPFWFDMWQNDGWSRRVARNWSSDTAFRGSDESFLQEVIPTLAPDQLDYIERVLRDEEDHHRG